MKRTVIICFALLIVMSASIAMAESIAGRVGVTGQIGFLVPSDSEAFEPYTPVYKLDSDVGFVGGGGLIFGLNSNLALELNITYTEFEAKIAGFKEGDFDTTNISFGVQYRFVGLPVQSLVPYVGGGLDVLLNNFSSTYGDNLDVDTVAGVHVSGGVDYFLTPQLAVNAELKGVLAPDADINYVGMKVGNYDPTSLAMTFGIRFFFY